MQNPTLSTIQTDYSQIQKGDWFLPMTVKGVDQHAFISEAIERGAVGFTYEDGQSIPSTTVPSFKVPNLRDYLFALAIQKRNESLFKVAAITGSVGKTSVKELVGSILNAWLPFNSFYSPHNLNTKIALASQVLRMPSDCKWAVFETGARKVSDLKIPIMLLQPEVSVLLNIGSAHVGEFGSMDNLRKEKLSLLNAPTAKTLVVYRDDLEIFEHALKLGKKVLSFGRSEKSDVRLLEETDSQVKLIFQGYEYTFNCAFVGSAKGLNVAAAFGVAQALDIPIEAIRKGLNNFTGTPRRFQIFQWGTTLAVDDAYNASPESMEEGLQKFSTMVSNKKPLLILGSMLELGPETEKSHRHIAGKIKSLFAEAFNKTTLGVATIGREAQFIADELQILGLHQKQIQSFDSTLEAKDFVNFWRLDFDAIYLKGSKSIHLEKLLGDK